jgi:hypothetical protein
MAAENSEAWYIKDAASCTTPEAFVGEKLVRERGAGSGEQGAGISSPNFLEF